MNAQIKDTPVVSQIAPEPPHVETPKLKTVKELVDEKCQATKLDCILVNKIAKAESKYLNVPNYLYTDENGHYTAYGIFQITRTTYRAFCGKNVAERMDIEKNIDCALKIMRVSGYQHWSESQDSWDN